MKLEIENIRGFAGKHELHVKPLTILVGENSSGKTTLLSTLFAALQPDFPTIDAFNRTPFELGSFDTIATYRGGKYGRALTFSIGWESETRNGDYSITAKYEGRLGIPRIKELNIARGSASLTGSFNSGEWTLRDGKKQPITFNLPPDQKRPPSLSDLLRLIFEDAHVKRLKSKAHQAELPFDLLIDLTSGHAKPRVTALAPLRSRPHRTYDELIEEFKPEGDHVPLVLARALASGEKQDQQLSEALQRFGVESGLFASLKVKRMGRQPSDPFQVRVKSAGPDANLVDVGYGVSQALPVVVESLLTPRNQVVLIQQPEVHLHPRAQAALGTFFAELSRSSAKSFVIETHSDFLVDRVRQAVANGVIEKDKVNIAFLERNGLDVFIHELSLDDKGNIENAPPAYRSFFLEEEMRLLFRGQ